MHELHRFLTNSSMRAVHTYMYTLFICTRTHNQMEALPNDHACLLYYMYTHFPLCFFFLFLLSVSEFKNTSYTKNTFRLFKTNNEFTCIYDRKITEPE